MRPMGCRGAEGQDAVREGFYAVRGRNLDETDRGGLSVEAGVGD